MGRAVCTAEWWFSVLFEGSVMSIYDELCDAWEGEGNCERVSFGEWMREMAENPRGTLQNAADDYLSACVECPFCNGEDVYCTLCEGAFVIPEGSAKEWSRLNRDT